MEKNSFVFHFVYLHDIPEELRGQWALNIIDYAETGNEPELSTWMEQKLWNSIKDRIKSDSEAYNKKVEYQKEYKERKKREKNGSIQNIPNIPKIPETSEYSENSRIFQNFQNIPTQCEYDSDSVSESVSVYESESVSVSDSVNESVFGSGYVEPSPSKTKTKSAEKKTKKKTEIVKPSLNEVMEYCKEKNYTFSAEKFWTYYEQNSWGVRFYNESGKCIRFVPVKDWKKKADEWQERQTDFNPSPPISNNKNVDEYESYFMNKEGENVRNENTSELPNF